ncbi:unnamed protein product [Cuscuta campestris]|uniref:Uncharacterized protein n=1 Tax=Cuscuta campestris TaxID=132261 RepID=A0A484L2Q2_9ASTE|nr:unnamed protein product [Cuscuta campestris]
MERSSGADFKGLADSISSLSGAEGGVFDASRYAFFERGTGAEVELGCLESEEGSSSGSSLPVAGGVVGGDDQILEYHLFEKDEGSGLGSLSDLDDLATTFLKVSKMEFSIVQQLNSSVLSSLYSSFS